VTHILLLSSSQPIRRTGALLGSTLYNCALREFDAAFSTAPEEFLGATTTFITTLVGSNEELMYIALQQTFQRSGDDKYDPATNARCEEALRARMELDERNIISLARMYVDKSSKADEDAMNSLVKLHMVD